MPLIDGWVELKAQPIREARALCGCTLVWVLAEGIDIHSPECAGGRFLWNTQPVIVPCQEGLDHVVLMRDAWAEAEENGENEVVDLEQVLREFERLREPS